MTKRWEANCVRVGQPKEHTSPARSKASQTQPPLSVQTFELPAAYNGRMYVSHRVTKPEPLIWQRQSRL